MKSSLDVIHPDLLAAQHFAYEPSGLLFKDIKKEKESEEYGAFMFKINDYRIKFRVGKITPTKVGQFVTLWKRVGSGPIQPHDMTDPVDFFIISVRNAERFGQFVFPKAVLCEQGIISKERRGGKRAMRVYPAWDVTTSQQAKKTQAWQLKYFFEINPNKQINPAEVRKLFTAGDAKSYYLNQPVNC